MFSDRTAIARSPNRLSSALEAARRAGQPILDLTVSNPTRAGFPYAEERILASLANPRALRYSPEPFGLAESREAVAALYGELGAPLPAANVLLTASTSEAYGFLFKLLCDPGDEVLAPQPSYPLFELLARLEQVTLVPYRLAYDGEWHVDLASIKSRITRRTRAILVVNPNNPTGSYLKEDELRGLAATGLPIVSDEVFAAFPLKPQNAEPTARRRVQTVLADDQAPLAFALNGLSKMAALPQMKLGWIAVGGSDQGRVAEALNRLELVADTFLSVGTPVQLAVAELLAERNTTGDAIRARLSANLEALRALVAGSAVTVLDVEGGWYATLRLPATEAEEEWALRFLEGDGTYVHPGHFFDFADEAYVVVSLLTPKNDLSEGIRRIVTRVDAACG